MKFTIRWLAASFCVAASAQSVPPPQRSAPNLPPVVESPVGAAPNTQNRPLAPCDLPPQPEALPQTWPGGVVYFEFDANVTPVSQYAMYVAMDKWNSCGARVAFVPRTPSVQASGYVHIQDASVNNSLVGKSGLSQVMNIFNWNYTYIMAHELCHALGFWHEQSRWDRDAYVTIITANIASGESHNFTKHAIGDWLTTATPYDFDSVMHYGQCDFTACSSCTSGCETILCNFPYNILWQNSIGQYDHLSTDDIADMQAVYGTGLQPRYVMYGIGALHNGRMHQPYWYIADADAAAPAGSTLYVQSGVYDEGVLTLDNHMVITPFGGPVTLR